MRFQSSMVHHTDDCWSFCARHVRCENVKRDVTQRELDMSKVKHTKKRRRANSKFTSKSQSQRRVMKNSQVFAARPHPVHAIFGRQSDFKFQISPPSRSRPLNDYILSSAALNMRKWKVSRLERKKTIICGRVTWASLKEKKIKSGAKSDEMIGRGSYSHSSRWRYIIMLA